MININDRSLRNKIIDKLTDQKTMFKNAGIIFKISSNIRYLYGDIYPSIKWAIYDTVENWKESHD
jgi:hypothetical protein